MPSRSRPLFTHSERVDIPDMEAVVLSGRVALYHTLSGLLFGSAPAHHPFANATGGGWADVSGVQQANASLSVVGSEITFTPRLLWAGETFGDGETVMGAATGPDGDATQTLDFTGVPNGVYKLWVRAEYLPGASATRIFWDEGASAEAAQPTDTRLVSGWRCGYTIDADPLPVGAALIARTTWATPTHALSYADQQFLFEGTLDASGVEGAAVWGAGTTRNTNRALYGVKSLSMLAAAIRTQFAAVLGGSQKWYEVPVISLTGLNTRTLAQHNADGTHNIGFANLNTPTRMVTVTSVTGTTTRTFTLQVRDWDGNAQAEALYVEVEVYGDDGHGHPDVRVSALERTPYISGVTTGSRITGTGTLDHIESIDTNLTAPTTLHLNPSRAIIQANASGVVVFTATCGSNNNYVYAKATIVRYGAGAAAFVNAGAVIVRA